jgi:hypothetical protein
MSIQRKGGCRWHFVRYIYYPYGKADLRDQSCREVEVKTADYVDTLLRYKVWNSS